MRAYLRLIRSGVVSEAVDGPPADRAKAVADALRAVWNGAIADALFEVETAARDHEGRSLQCFEDPDGCTEAGINHRQTAAAMRKLAETIRAMAVTA